MQSPEAAAASIVATVEETAREDVDRIVAQVRREAIQRDVPLSDEALEVLSEVLGREIPVSFLTAFSTSLHRVILLDDEG